MEFVSIDYALCDISKGKGYNELLMIAGAVGKSEFIREAGAFFKVTGRYPVYNLDYFVDAATRAIDGGCKLYCDIKDHKVYDWLRLGWNGHSFECRLFACTNSFFMERFFPRVQECNDYEGRSMEYVLFKAVSGCDERMVVRFRREPHLGGLAGHQIDAISFSQTHDGLKSKVKRLVGNSIRIFIPWFKF